MTRNRVAVLLGLVLSLSWVQASFAQMIVVDPRSIPNGSPLDQSADNASSGAASSAGTNSGSQTASIPSVNPTPAFQTGSLSNPSSSTLLDNGTFAGEQKTAPIKPAAAPGEFEKYVKDATGEDVKRFGADLLVPAARDFSVPATATIPGDYPIGIGDVISINTIGSIEGSADFTVDRNGEIFLPKVGHVKLIGVRYRDLHDRIAAAIGRQYRGYEVTVSIQRLRGIRVYVTGFANNPGAYSLNSLSTLVNAVLAAGGPTSGGSFRTIKLYRNGKEVRDFDLYDLIRHGDNAGDAVLQNEDVLFIPPVGPQVAVIGSVNESAIYEAKPGETLEDLVRIAGGPNQLADPSRAIVYRLDDKNTVGSRDFSRAQLAATPSQPGDIIQVLSQGSLVHPMERQSVIVRIEG